MNRQHEEIIKQQINRIMEILEVEYPYVFKMDRVEGNYDYYITNNVLGTVHIGNYKATAEFLLGIIELMLTQKGMENEWTPEIHWTPVEDLEEFK